MLRHSDIPDHPLSCLGRFVRANRVKAVRVAVRAGVSLGYVRALLVGKSEPTRRVMVAITEAMCYVVRRRVEVAELFDLELHVPPYYRSTQTAIWAGPPPDGSVVLDPEVHDLLAVLVDMSELVEIVALFCERRAPHLKAAELLRFCGRDACTDGLRRYGVMVNRLRVGRAADEVHEQ